MARYKVIISHTAYEYAEVEAGCIEEAQKLAEERDFCDDTLEEIDAEGFNVEEVVLLTPQD